MQYSGIASAPKLLWEQWSNLFGFSAKYLSTVSSVLSELDESPKDNWELMVCVLICTSISQFTLGQKGKVILLRIGDSYAALL